MVKENKIERSWPFLLTFFALTIACIVFGILCIYGTNVPWIQNYKGLWIALAVSLLCAFCGLCVWFVIAAKNALARTAISVYVFLLFCLILIFIFEITGFFEIVRTPESLEAYLTKAGVWMPILYIVLQYLQVVLLPIPSTVSTLAGVALFGPFKTIIYSLLGIIPASITAFFVGRKLGNKAVAWIVGEEVLDKWQKKLKGKDNFLLTIMFVLPMFPDDVLCFIAGLSSMSFKYFLIMITLSRILAISVTCYSLELIPLNEWWGLVTWGILIVLVVTAFVLIYKNLDKIQAWIKSKKKRKGKKE